MTARFTSTVIAVALRALPSLATTSICESTQAEREARAITMAARAFHADYGVFPPNDTWLTELAFPSNAVINSRQILYLDVAPRGAGFADPWGLPYHYRNPGKRNTQSVDVWSTGKDRTSESDGDDADDINNWNTKRPWLTAAAYRWEPCNSWVMRNTALTLLMGLGGLLIIFIVIRKARTSGSSVFLTRGTPPAGQESRRGSESAEP